jgi:hypothetical protein
MDRGVQLGHGHAAEHGHVHKYDRDVDYYRTGEDSGQLYFSEDFAEELVEVHAKVSGSACKNERNLADVLAE